MNIISRKEAVALGLKRYFTGKPCKRCHVCERSIYDRGCIECKKERESKYKFSEPFMEKKRATNRRCYLSKSLEQKRALNRRRYLSCRDKVLEKKKIEWLMLRACKQLGLIRKEDLI